ncbi:6-aminohexanoate hydrolase [Rhizobium rhizosphaerae]|uniref:6-aminohexanoate hydrolase n=1 Tax=Xaviernesmea rhizosphaerae TaxID=1672749 RepID=A0A1Q9AM88_9HYPH|nr:serine hydrolase [Xaviernesmea rhizosphaerae]OLP56517.1 6-aminohexanoate hydrolase [Xaviernesmea rhizosphaerae]OQP87820.1 6-aminohexanoate hydrolase [Xaviernesmea rhizosphaerae]
MEEAMRKRGIFSALAAGVAVILAGAAGWLAAAPPELLLVGDGYAAKIVCSNVFLAGREAGDVLADDVQAPGNPLLRLVRVTVDRERKTVTARMFGFAAPGHAIYREGLGCTNVSPGEFAAFPGNRSLRRRTPQLDDTKPWPDGNGTRIEPMLQALVEDDRLAGPGARALLVLRNGVIVAERYGDGFGAATPLLGWSMAKTVTAALIGLRIRDGAMALDKASLLPEWRGDGRARITLADLMAMQSGLSFNESYGSVTDVTRMLFLENDMARFAAAQPLQADPGAQFRYSSGTTMILSRLWMDSLPSAREALTYPRAQLFRPLGMSSAVLEPDAHGTFVGSSYMYATARDWGRFAQFLAQGGQWKGEALLPPGYVEAMRRPTAASGGRYGGGQVWTRGPETVGPYPQDSFWMRGHDGQSIMIVPSRGLVVLRMGLTPRASGYSVEPLERAVLERLPALPAEGGNAP